MAEYVRVSQRELENILRYLEPKGQRFIYKLCNGSVILDGRHWVAVDNMDGEARMEAFYLKDAAIKWVTGSQPRAEIIDVKTTKDYYEVYRDYQIVCKHPRRNNSIERIKAQYGYGPKKGAKRQ